MKSQRPWLEGQKVDSKMWELGKGMVVSESTSQRRIWHGSCYEVLAVIRHGKISCNPCYRRSAGQCHIFSKPFDALLQKLQNADPLQRSGAPGPLNNKSLASSRFYAAFRGVESSEQKTGCMSKPWSSSMGLRGMTERSVRFLCLFLSPRPSEPSSRLLYFPFCIFEAQGVAFTQGVVVLDRCPNRPRLDAIKTIPTASGIQVVISVKHITT